MTGPISPTQLAAILAGNSRRTRLDPLLEQLVQAELKSFQAFLDAGRSTHCRDVRGNKLTKPPPLYYGAHERWLENWSKYVLAHNRACVHCSSVARETPEPACQTSQSSLDHENATSVS